MAGFTGRHDEVLTLPLSVGDAMAAWFDMARQGRCTPDTVSAHPQGADRLVVVLKEERAGTVRFQGRYTMFFTQKGDTIRWQTAPEDNMEVRGTARFSATASGCKVVFSEQIDADLGLNRLIARAVKPVADRIMERGQRKYLDALMAELRALCR